MPIIPAPNIEYSYRDTYRSNMNCVNGNCGENKYNIHGRGTPKENFQRPYNPRTTNIGGESRVRRKARQLKTLSNNKSRARNYGRRFAV